MDIDKILTVFIMIMFQRILNKLDEVEGKASTFPDVDMRQCSSYRTLTGVCELIEMEPPVPEVQLDHVDAPRYVVLYAHAGKTHSLGVVRDNDTCTVFSGM